MKGRQAVVCRFQKELNSERASEKDQRIDQDGIRFSVPLHYKVSNFVYWKSLRLSRKNGIINNQIVHFIVSIKLRRLEK